MRMLERDWDAVTYSQNCKFPSQVCKHSLSVRMSELVLVQSGDSSFIEVMKLSEHSSMCSGGGLYFFFFFFPPSGISVTVTLTLRFVLTMSAELSRTVFYSFSGRHMRRWKFLKINNVLLVSVDCFQNCFSWAMAKQLHWASFMVSVPVPVSVATN